MVFQHLIVFFEGFSYKKLLAILHVKQGVRTVRFTANNLTQIHHSNSILLVQSEFLSARSHIAFQRFDAFLRGFLCLVYGFHQFFRINGLQQIING